jgi:hypothetical protein
VGKFWRNFSLKNQFNSLKFGREKMKKLILIALVAGGFAFGLPPKSIAGVAVGIGFGFPGAYPYPYYGYGYPYPYYGYVYPYWYGPGFYWYHGHRAFFSHPWRGARYRHWR